MIRAPIRHAVRRSNRETPFAWLLVAAAALVACLALAGSGRPDRDEPSAWDVSTLVSPEAGVDSVVVSVDLLDTLDHLDDEVDAIALAYADVVPASPSESPLEAVQRELRADVARLSANCRERGPSPSPGAPGAACEWPLPPVDPPKAGPAPVGTSAPAMLAGVALRTVEPVEPAGTDPAPLLRPPAA